MLLWEGEADWGSSASHVHFNTLSQARAPLVGLVGQTWVSSHCKLGRDLLRIQLLQNHKINHKVSFAFLHCFSIEPNKCLFSRSELVTDWLCAAQPAVHYGSLLQSENPKILKHTFSRRKDAVRARRRPLCWRRGFVQRIKSKWNIPIEEKDRKWSFIRTDKGNNKTKNAPMKTMKTDQCVFPNKRRHKTVLIMLPSNWVHL